MIKKIIFLLSIIIVNFSCTTYELSNIENSDKVLFLGDSIFYGVGLVNRNKNNIPGVVHRLSNQSINILNISKIGSTILSKGDNPFWTLDTARKVEEYSPDTTVILLGTNDSKKHNWKYKEDFDKDYRAIISFLKGINQDMEIYICTLPPAYFNIWDINGDRINKDINPLIREIGHKSEVNIIELHNLFNNKKLLFDNIHPNIEGSTLVGNKIYSTIFSKYIDQ